MKNHSDDHRNKGKMAPVDHPYLQNQLVYNRSLETAPPYTRALWDKEHSWICGDINRFYPLK